MAADEYVLGQPQRPVEPFRAKLWDSMKACGRAIARHGRALTLAVIFGSPAVFSGWLIGYATVHRLIDPLHGVYLALVVTIFMMSLALFIISLQEDKRIFVESHWGGLGGGLGGWRISRSLVFLGTTAVTFALLAGALTERPTPDLRERYRAAMNFAAKNNMPCDDRGIVDRRLVVQCAPPSNGVYTDFWNQIKLANASHDDIVVVRSSSETSGTRALN